ncbi:three-Cys-motif partner protein TcmP [Streptomyces griseus]|uniref:three-Cys-motif partner protein TcmP n=1 Tax=Streptomyces griseus TaxID=1911 RepID=UPI003CEB6814
MSAGTTGTYWQGKALPSVFKHDLLRRYLPPFGGMTGTQSLAGRVVYLDGYAGEGRYESGEPGSAEIALRVAEHHSDIGLNMSCFFVEQQSKSFERLQAVVESYRSKGVQAEARQGGVDDVLDDVIHRAVGVPLFLFLDPCGLGLPFERLVAILAKQRRETWPPTELLMNFSMMAVRRLGGHVTSPKGNERSLERFDETCGGRWWREYFSGDLPRQQAAEAVAEEYKQRLGKQTDMFVQSVPVSHSPHKEPVYHLVFGTRSTHGLWVFGDAAARARDAWWQTLDLQEDDGLFSTASVLRPDPRELEKAAVPAMARNLDFLLQRTRGPVKLVDYPLEVFGEHYGQVKETAARSAVKLLNSQGRTPSNGVGVRRTRDIIVTPGPLPR